MLYLKCFQASDCPNIIFWGYAQNVFKPMIIFDSSITKGTSMCTLFFGMPPVRRWAMMDC